MKKLAIVLLLVLPVLVVAGALLWSTGFFASPLRVELVEVTRASLQRSINTNGKVESDRVYELRALAAGACRLLGLHEGSRLRKGQQIVGVDDPSLPSQLSAAEAELDAARLDLSVVLRGPAPEELNQAKADLARASLAAGNARKTVETNEWLLARSAIARYELEQSRHALAEAEQQRTAAETRLEDLKKRYGDLDIKRARARVDAAEARLRFLQDSGRRLIVAAPADGVLYQLDVKEGSYVNPGDPVGLLADLSSLRVRAYVDEPDLGQVVPGEQAVIRWDAYPQERWTGTVTRLPAQVVTLGTRSVAQVLIGIDDSGGKLLPNVNVDVEIRAAESLPVVSLPRGLVFPEGEREFAWVIENGQAARRFIETGGSTSTRIEIKSGLSPGDKVIDPGDLPISEGVKVEARVR